MAGGSSTRFSSEAHLRIGRWLRSKWHLDSLIAIGGMASVYAGTHRNGARAAIKVLHAQYTRNEQARRRFLAEGYAANKVGHRNAVSVLDDDTTEDGEVYLVMELLDGESFEGRLERVGVMNPIEVLQITDQMLEVLSAAHNRGILHRDIKPANIYLCRDGSVKLLDFGLARVRELSAEALDQSDGIVFGTVSYIAPEQARADNQNLDARSDMWSVAATMFRALTGETVFPAEGPVIERLLAVARKPARSIATVNPRLPRPVIELIDRTLAFNPEDRWPSANVMRAVVQDVVAQLEEDAAAAAEAEQHAPLFSHRPEYNPPSPSPSPSPVPQSQRPRGEPAAPQQSQRPRTDPPQAGKQEPMARPTSPVRPEPSPTPVPRDESFDEIDLDVENMTEPRPGKRARTRTLLTKEGRAELRRILDARRGSLGIPGGKAEATPEPVQVAAPVKPEPVAAPVKPEPAAVQPRTRPTTEPSPTATVQPGQRGGPSHEPSASDSFLGADLLIEEPSLLQSGLVVLQPEEPSMMESGLVVLQPEESATLQPEPPPQSEPEESIIEVTIQHTRSEAFGTIAEPLGEPPARPGPGDSMTTAAFPAIGGPRPATPAARPPGPATQEAEERAPEARPTASYPALGAPPAKATSSYPTIGVPPTKTTASYPAIGTPPARSTASYPAVGAPPATAKPTPARSEAPTRSEETKIGPAPLAPTRSSSPDITKVGPAPLAPTSAKPEAAKPASEPTKAAAAPATPSGSARPEEPASEVSRSARAPLPTFGRPGAPAATPTGAGLPGPLPSRSSQSDATRPASQSPVSGEIGEARGQASSSGRWAPPGGQLPTRPSGETRPTHVTTGATRPAEPPTSPAPAKIEAPLRSGEPASAARPNAPTPGKPIEAPASPTRPTSEAKAETRPTAKPVEGVKPAPGGAVKPASPAKPGEPMRTGDPRPPASVATRASEANASRAVEPARPEDNKPTVTTKSGEMKAVTKPVEAKPVEAKPVEAKPAVKSNDVKPAPASEARGGARPGAAKPVEAKAASDEAAAIKHKPGEPASAKAEARPAEAKPEEARPEPIKEEAPAKQDEPTPDPLRLPGSGLSRPAPTKSVFAVPYANLGKPSERGEAKPAGKSEPDPTKPKKPG